MATSSAETMRSREYEHAVNEVNLDENVHSQIYRKKISQQQQKIQHLTDYVVRLEAVLKEYQVAYPELKPATKLHRQPSEGLEGTSTIIAWAGIARFLSHDSYRVWW